MFHAVSAKALPTQQRHGVERHHAVRAAAIGDDIPAFPQLAQSPAQICERQGNRTWEVSRHVLLARADVDERDLAGADAAHELVIVDWLQRAAFLEVLARDVLDFCQPGLSQASKMKKEVTHLWICESIRHVQAGLLGLDETRAPEHLQMVRGRRDALARLLGKRFDGACAL